MVRVNMMNQKTFDKMSNDFVAFSELIKTRQDEKQSVLDEFELELKRFKSGQISENTLKSSIKKKTKELDKVDSNIETAIKKGLDLAKRMTAFSREQKPIKYKVGLSGISGGETKKKAAKKKTSAKKASEKKASKKVSKKASKKTGKKKTAGSKKQVKKKSSKKTAKKKPKITKAQIAEEMKQEKKLRK